MRRRRALFSPTIFISARPNDDLAFYRDLTLKSRAAEIQSRYIFRCSSLLYGPPLCSTFVTFIRDCSFAHYVCTIYIAVKQPATRIFQFSNIALACYVLQNNPAR